MALITVAQAKEHIPLLTADSTAEDSRLTTIIGRVGRVFARYCGYPPATVGANPTMESASYVLHLDGPGGQELRLPVWPVTAVTSIYDDPDRNYTSSYLVSSSDYDTEGSEGLVILRPNATHGAWSTSRRAIKATFTGGYSTVPDDLALAACLMTRHVWDLKNTQGRGSVSQGEQNAQLRPETIPDVVREVLEPFRLPSVYL